MAVTEAERQYFRQQAEDYARNGEPKLTKAQERRIEGALYDFAYIEQHIKTLEDEINFITENAVRIAAPPTDSPGAKTYRPADNTGEAAQRLADNPRIREIKKDIRWHRREQQRVEIALQFLKKYFPEMKQFIERKYFQLATAQELQREMFIEKSAFYKYRREVLHRVAALWGWL